MNDWCSVFVFEHALQSGIFLQLLSCYWVWMGCLGLDYVWNICANPNWKLSYNRPGVKWANFWKSLIAFWISVTQTFQQRLPRQSIIKHIILFRHGTLPGATVSIKQQVINLLPRCRESDLCDGLGIVICWDNRTFNHHNLLVSLSGFGNKSQIVWVLPVWTVFENQVTQRI